MKETEKKEKPEHPNVFISYSWDDEEHIQWVHKLASNLRSHGVNIIIDQWDARLGDDLPFFMEQGLSTSALVLCVCSDKYVEKANTNKGGVGYEKKILAANLINDSSNNYIIPIKRKNITGKTPTFLSGSKYIDFEKDSDYFNKYDELLQRIYNEDIKKRPPLGENPFKHDELSKHISINLNKDQIKYCNPLLEGEVSFDYKRNNGDFIIGEGEYQFITYWSEAGMGIIHCYRDKVKRIGYNPSFKEFPSMHELEQFDFSSRAKAVREGEIIILENLNNKFAAIKITKVFCNYVDIDHLLEFDYKIYNGIN